MEMSAGTQYWHPGNPMDEQRNNESRRTVAELVAAIDQRTSRMETALFGPPGQEWMGCLSQTEIRLAAVEGRMWKAVVGTLVALAGVAWESLKGH
jgi:hypothetical protein